MNRLKRFVQRVLRKWSEQPPTLLDVVQFIIAVVTLINIIYHW